MQRQGAWQGSVAYIYPSLERPLSTRSGHRARYRQPQMEIAWFTNEKTPQSGFATSPASSLSFVSPFFSYRYINPTSREERAILANLSRYEIVSITVEPARSGYPSVISNSIAIRDKPGIGQFSNALSKIFLREPEHPRVTRAAILRIQLKDKTLGGYLEESSNDGTTFYCMSDITSDWVFGAYSVPGGGALFDAIPRLASAASKDTQPVVR